MHPGGLMFHCWFHRAQFRGEIAPMHSGLICMKMGRVNAMAAVFLIKEDNIKENKNAKLNACTLGSELLKGEQETQNKVGRCSKTKEVNWCERGKFGWNMLAQMRGK